MNPDIHLILDEPLSAFDAPTHIPYASITRHVWGDAQQYYNLADLPARLLFGIAPHYFTLA
jgi:hypothetical protein